MVHYATQLAWLVRVCSLEPPGASHVAMAHTTLGAWPHAPAVEMVKSPPAHAAPFRLGLRLALQYVVSRHFGVPLIVGLPRMVACLGVADIACLGLHDIMRPNLFDIIGMLL